MLRLAGTYPGVVELSSAVTCEPGYELAVGAALAQHPGTLVVPDGATSGPCSRHCARPVCVWRACSRRRAGHARVAGFATPSGWPTR